MSNCTKSTRAVLEVSILGRNKRVGFGANIIATVPCDTVNVGLSGHPFERFCQEADSVSCVYLVHGEYEVQEDFAKRLAQKGYEHVMIPDMHMVCGLNEVTTPEALGD